MGSEKSNRSRKITTRFDPAEYILIEGRFRKTSFRKLSEYIRSLLLEKPVTVYYRDRSMDEVLEELAILRREMNAVGNNLNQAVHQINAAHGAANNRLWSTLLAVIASQVEPNIKDVKNHIQRFSELWSQKLKQGGASSAP